MEINLLIHGYSADCESEFMRYISDSLRNQDHNVYELNLDYIKNGVEPSKNLTEELLQLKETVKELKNKGYKKINVIGKSIGGTLCLNPGIVNDNSINKILILGFPYILGFPPDLNLIRTKPITENPNAKNMYKNLFNNFENTEKIYIIQGRNDLLGTPEIIKDLMLGISIKPKIIYVKNSSHGFKPITKESSFRENFSNVKNIILKIL